MVLRNKHTPIFHFCVKNGVPNDANLQDGVDIALTVVAARFFLLNWKLRHKDSSQKANLDQLHAGVSNPILSFGFFMPRE
jgi:hypothetical protein